MIDPGTTKRKGYHARQSAPPAGTNGKHGVLGNGKVRGNGGEAENCLIMKQLQLTKMRKLALNKISDPK